MRCTQIAAGVDPKIGKDALSKLSEAQSRSSGPTLGVSGQRGPENQGHRLKPDVTNDPWIQVTPRSTSDMVFLGARRFVVPWYVFWRAGTFPSRFVRINVGWKKRALRRRHATMVK